MQPMSFDPAIAGIAGEMVANRAQSLAADSAASMIAVDDRAASAL
jgi:hypothetical protein